MRWKWFVGICGLALLTGITIGYAFLSTFDFNELKPSIERAVTSVTGRDLKIEGDIRCKVGLTPTIVIGDVRFQNAPWGSEPWMMQARELRLRVALVPLLHRNIRIRELAVLEPELLLEKDPSGTFNTALLQTAEAPSAQQEEHFDSLAAAMVTMLAFDGVRVERGRLIFREGSSTGHTVEVDLLEARASSATSPIFLIVRGSYRNVPFEASGTLAPIATLLDPDIPHAVEVAGRLGEIEAEAKGVVKDIWSGRGVRLTFLGKSPSGAPLTQWAGFPQVQDLGPFEFSVTASDPSGRWIIDKFRLQAGRRELVRLELTGTISDPLGASGLDLTFRAHGNDLKKLGTLLASEVPAGGTFDLSGRVRDKGKKTYHLSSVDATIHKNQVKGSLTVDFSSTRPSFSGAFSAGSLDLRPFFPQRKNKSTPVSSKPKKVFPNTPLPLEPLKQADVDLALHVETLVVPRVTLNALRAHVQVSDGHLSLQEFQSVIAGGSFAGDLDVRPGDPAPTVKASLKVEHLNLHRFLKEMGVAYALDGDLDIDIAVIGSGRSVAGLLAGLDGEISMGMGEGLIDNKYLNYLGADVATTTLRIFNPYEKENHSTQINCFVGRFDIQDGVARSTALVMDTADTVVVGDGEVDLESEALDLSLKPTVKRGIGVDGIGKLSLNLGQLTRPLKLTGTLSDPDLAVDPAQTAVLVGKALGGITVFGPVGIAAVLVSGSFGGKNPCLAAIEAAEKKKQDRNSSKEQQEGARIKGPPEDVGGTLYWQNER